MKKSLLALAALTAFAGAASAQSSVTLSGTLDAGVRRQGTGIQKPTPVAGKGKLSGTDDDWSIGGSQSGYNGFTMSGIEDLGNGTRAIFSLNHRFVLGTGAVNGTTNASPSGTNPSFSTPFWRNAYVGLGGGFGEVRIGRYLAPLQDLNGNYDPFGTGTVGQVNTGGIAATLRANNLISYRTPSLGGFTMQVAVATASDQVAEEIGAGSPQGYFAPTAKLLTEKPVGFNARYKAGPVDVGVGYDKNGADLKTVGVYAAYDLGVVKLMGQFEKGDNFTAADATGVAEKIKAFSFGLTAPLGPVLLRTGFLKIKSDRANRDMTKFGFGGDYILSKRTNLYATVGKWSGNRVANPLLNATGLTTTQANARLDTIADAPFNSAAVKKARFDFGITHRF